jgi:hypothetical protein
MREIFLFVLLLGSLGACASDENGISGSSTPPAAASPAASGEVVGSVLWDPIAQTPRDARQTARQACARHGLDARTTGETRQGAAVTTDYVCE